MRATCEFAEKKGHAELPYIRLKIYKTKNDITIKISDCGGGIPRASSGKIFNYMYSTAPQVHILYQPYSYCNECLVKPRVYLVEHKLCLYLIAKLSKEFDERNSCLLLVG